jgi:uncharacterized protein (DUF305 family)
MTRKRIATWLTVAAAGIGPVTSVLAQNPPAQPPAERPQHQQQPARQQQDQQHMMQMSDQQFVPMMIRHHREGIEMARLVEEKGSSGEIKTLAGRIHERDIRELERLGQAAHSARQADEHGKMMEQQSEATMQRLRSASGPQLDQAFVDEMIKHHQAAIRMAEGAKLENPELKELSRKMVATQHEELTSLQKQQAALGASR